MVSPFYGKPEMSWSLRDKIYNTIYYVIYLAHDQCPQYIIICLIFDSQNYGFLNYYFTKLFEVRMPFLDFCRT